MGKLSLLALASLMLGATLLLTDQLSRNARFSEADAPRVKELAREVAMVGLSEARAVVFDAYATHGQYAGPRMWQGHAYGGIYHATLRSDSAGVTIRVRGQLGLDWYSVERRYRYAPVPRHPRLRGRPHHLPQ